MAASAGTRESTLRRHWRSRSVDTSWPIAKAYAAVPGPLEFYGVLIQQFADVLHFVVSGSTARLQPDDPDTYLYQGIANLIVAVVAVTALAAALAIVSARPSPARSRGR